MEERKRQVFYSFHYDNDSQRAAQIRNIGAIEGNRAAPGNDWETIKRGGDAAIEKWIAEQMRYRTCTVVLIGSATADRKWINHEIIKSWRDGMGLVGVYIHNIKDLNQRQSVQGINPFSKITHKGKPLSDIIRTYNAPYSDSKMVYSYISQNIANWTNEAVQIRSQY